MKSNFDKCRDLAWCAVWAGGREQFYQARDRQQIVFRTQEDMTEQVMDQILRFVHSEWEDEDDDERRL
jgi:hypothetical protein